MTGWTYGGTLVVIALILIFCAVVVLGWRGKRGGLARPAASGETVPYHEPIIRASEETGVPAWLLVRLLQSESGLDPEATGGPNSDGSFDHGIAQLNGRYLTYYADKYASGILDPYDPLQAIPVAARYMADLYKLTGCWACAVIAYKMGPGKLLEMQAQGVTLPAGWLTISGEHDHGGDR